LKKDGKGKHYYCIISDVDMDVVTYCFKVRVNALKVLVIYERFKFFYKIFETETKMSPKDQKKMANDWLLGKLNGPEEMLMLPERFGQLIFAETQKVMKERKPKN
jgi:hypothetical protein